MNQVIVRNSRGEQYLCAARKKFYEVDGNLSETTSKMFFCHFTDIHCDWKRFDNVIEIIKYFNPFFAVHTGDLVCWDSQSDTNYFYDETTKLDIPVYNCIGNHETFKGDVVLTNEYLHNRYIRPLKNNIITTGKGYYYTDFAEHGVRLIILNNYENEKVKKYSDRIYEINQEQIDWFIKVLKDSEQLDFGVIIASHEADEPVLPGSNKLGFCQRIEPHPWGAPEAKHPHIIADIVDAFQNGKELKKEYQWKKSGNAVIVDCSFEKKSEFICYINGHRHGDYIGYLPSYPKQLSLGMTCSGCFPEEYHNIGDEISDLPRIPETISEDAVNFYVLDRVNKIISVVRMGASVNDLFEERIAAKFHYGMN